MRGEVRDGFFEEVGKSPELEAIVTGIASEVVTAAQATAPVDTREYKESIVVEVHRGSGRVVARAVAKAPHSMAVEARTGNLQRAGRSVAR